MKIVRKQIDVVAIFKRKELPIPARVRMDIDGREMVAKIDQIVKVQHQKNVGKGEIIYTCQSHINGKDWLYEIKFLLDTLEWVLYKI